MTAIAEYYAKVGIRTDAASIRKLDTYFSSIERRMAEMQTKMANSFIPKQAVLNKGVREALDNASKGAVLNIRRFSFDRPALNKEATTAISGLSRRTVFKISRYSFDKARLQNAMAIATRGAAIDNFSVDRIKLRVKLREALASASTQVPFKIERFQPNATVLRTEVKAAFTKVSELVPFQVSRFIVDRVRLRRALMLASRDFTVNMNPDVSGRGNGPRGYGPDRVELERLRHSQRMELERLKQQGSLARSAGFGAAAGTGMLGAHGGRLPGLIGGGYLTAMGLRGIGNLNQANQELISTQLTTQAVVESYGLEGQGPEAFKWLQRLGNNLGFNYMDQAQDYNSFLANALGAGQSLGGAQGIYKGFAEYQRAMGITPARQKLVMSALSQMMGKGVVSILA